MLRYDASIRYDHDVLSREQLDVLVARSPSCVPRVPPIVYARPDVRRLFCELVSTVSGGQHRVCVSGTDFTVGWPEFDDEAAAATAAAKRAQAENNRALAALTTALEGHKCSLDAVNAAMAVAIRHNNKLLEAYPGVDAPGVDAPYVAGDIPDITGRSTVTLWLRTPYVTTEHATGSEQLPYAIVLAALGKSVSTTWHVLKEYPTHITDGETVVAYREAASLAGLHFSEQHSLYCCARRSWQHNKALIAEITNDQRTIMGRITALTCAVEALRTRMAKELK